MAGSGRGRVLRRVLLSQFTDSAVVAEVALTRDEPAVAHGAAHGALAMTTPDDTTLATKAEVLKLGGGGGVQRGPQPTRPQQQADQRFAPGQRQPGEQGVSGWWRLMSAVCEEYARKFRKPPTL